MQQLPDCTTADSSINSYLLAEDSSQWEVQVLSRQAEQEDVEHQAGEHDWEGGKTDSDERGLHVQSSWSLQQLAHGTEDSNGPQVVQIKSESMG